MGAIHTKESIKEQLLVKDAWVHRAVTAIYEYQTADEQRVDETRENNGVGFNGPDARILSSFAKQIKAWNAAPAYRRYPAPLSTAQMRIARKKILKYSGQLARIANKEI